ncbi:MAG: chemotaxis protein [Candidatus Methanoperedenaceae archaeon]|nr:MAG: chemotaxis protein [Candidatus Methanoperedenaceae archaeon]
MSIGKKIIGGYIFVLLLMIIAVSVGYYSINIVDKNYNKLIDFGEVQILNSGTLRLLVEQQKADYQGLLLYKDDPKTYQDLLYEDRKLFEDARLEAQKSELAENDEVSLGILRNIAELQAEYEKEQDKIISLTNEGKHEEAINVSINEIRPVRTELINTIDKYVSNNKKKESESRAVIIATNSRFSLLMIVSSIIAFISGSVIGLYITRSITYQLRDATGRLSSSSAEILATTTQLAAGASETATAVIETTATTEEVRQISLLSGEKSRYISEIAQKAASSAHKGNTALAQNVEAINKIKGQMELVTQSIVKLSEQSQTIGEINTTVNDLAEQSNLLAVNAAIEAAKAGEQGKGFAVVAAEIKILAGQSKQATAQVRSILSEIQKATSAAVMATEQASKAVDAGVNQATEAGESIRNLTETIKEASEASTQGAVSSQQQLTGIDQITKAMENIKQATQQNSAGAKQAERAAQDLNELGQKLKAMAEESKL